jgi:hypothetical protein
MNKALPMGQIGPLARYFLRVRQDARLQTRRQGLQQESLASTWCWQGAVKIRIFIMHLNLAGSTSTGCRLFVVRCDLSRSPNKVHPGGILTPNPGDFRQFFLFFAENLNFQLPKISIQRP